MFFFVHLFVFSSLFAHFIPTTCSISLSPSSILLVNDSKLFSLLISQENNEPLTELELIQLDYTLMKMRSLNLAPSPELLSLYRDYVLKEAVLYRDSSPTFDAESIWNIWMNELLESLSTPSIVNQLDRYSQLGLNPYLFGWYFYTSSATRLFERNGKFLQSHPDWDNLWHRAVTTSFNYLHGRVATTVKLPSQIRLRQYDEPVHPGEFLHYRAEAIQAVYNHMIIETSLGLLPSQLSQVVEFGGGTATHSVLLPSLGFKGVHFIYDMFPMALLQQYFLRYSGWPAYLGEKLYEADMKRENLNNPQYEAMSQGKNIRGRNIILETNFTHLLHHLNTSDLSNSLFFATYSITETPLHVRDAFLAPFQSPESRFGYYYLQLAPVFGTVNNAAWIYQLALQMKSTHNSCMWMNGNVDAVTFVAKRIDPLNPQESDVIKCHTITGCLVHQMYFCNTHIPTTNTSLEDDPTLFGKDEPIDH